MQSRKGDSRKGEKEKGKRGQEKGGRFIFRLDERHQVGNKSIPFFVIC